MDPSPALPPPWVTTTPTKALPAVPSPPAGLEEEGSSEQLKNLQRLTQQLQEAGAEVPPEIQATLKDLEASLMPAAPTISHKSVSQVQRWTNKVAKLHQQVEELDQGFDKAKAYLKTVYQEQKNTYLDLRKQAMEQLEEARQKLKDAQRAVQEASAQLSDPRLRGRRTQQEFEKACLFAAARQGQSAISGQQDGRSQIQEGRKDGGRDGSGEWSEQVTNYLQPNSMLREVADNEGSYTIRNKSNAGYVDGFLSRELRDVHPGGLSRRRPCGVPMGRLRVWQSQTNHNRHVQRFGTLLKRVCVLMTLWK